jgi:hypothetical protein
MIIKKFTKLKDMLKKHMRVVVFGTSILWAATALLSFMAITKPAQITETYLQNKVIHNTSFDYKAYFIKSSVYKDTVLSNPESFMVEKLLDFISIGINSSIKSDKPLTGKLKSKLTAELSSEDLPEVKELLPEAKIYETTVTSTDSTLINEAATIDFKKYIEPLLKSIEKDMNSRPSSYQIKIKFEVLESDVNFNGEQIPIKGSSEIVFESKNSRLMKISERKYTNEYPMNEYRVIHENFNIFGLSFGVIAARYLFLVMWILIGILESILIFSRHKVVKPNVSETNIINKKHKDKLFQLSKDININDKQLLELEKFTSLLQISEDKEIPILMYGKEDSTAYYAADGEFVYKYTATNTINTSSSEELTPILMGSDVNNGG